MRRQWGVGMWKIVGRECELAEDWYEMQSDVVSAAVQAVYFAGLDEAPRSPKLLTTTTVILTDGTVWRDSAERVIGTETKGDVLHILECSKIMFRRKMKEEGRPEAIEKTGG